MAYADPHTDHPKTCPRCKSKKIRPIAETPSGLHPWRCRKCGIIGYDDRIVGDHTDTGDEKPEPRRKRRGPSIRSRAAASQGRGDFANRGGD